MSDEAKTKADSAAGDKPAVVKKAAKKKGNGVAVKNISTRVINTSKGSIDPGESGFATEQECTSLMTWLEKA